MDSERVAKELVGLAKAMTSGFNAIFIIKDDIEFIYDPFSSHLQIGMGGEWWNGKVKKGVNSFNHRKESVDEAYQPVHVEVEYENNRLTFLVSGGFGLGPTQFVVGAS